MSGRITGFIAALASTAIFTVLKPVEHDGKPYEPGKPIELDEKQAQPLLDCNPPAIERGVPLVVLEPSCGAVFADELRELNAAVTAIRIQGDRLPPAVAVMSGTEAPLKR